MAAGISIAYLIKGVLIFSATLGDFGECRWKSCFPPIDAENTECRRELFLLPRRGGRRFCFSLFGCACCSASALIAFAGLWLVHAAVASSAFVHTLYGKTFSCVFRPDLIILFSA